MKVFAHAVTSVIINVNMLQFHFPLEVCDYFSPSWLEYAFLEIVHGISFAY